MDKIPLFIPIFDEEMQQAAASALANERAVGGESVHKFEEEFAQYIGVKHAVSVSSGTDALHLAVRGLGLEGKQILTTPMTFIATANSILHAGSKPYFCDIDETGNIDVNLIPGALKDGTGGMMPVHLYGYPCKMKEILDIAEEKGLKVIEDAAEAHGATIDGKRMGSLGDAGCFSFYTTKNMTVGGDGGMVTTNNEELAELIKKMRNCGRSTQDEMDVVGYTARLNTINAAIGRIQLSRLEEWNKRRREMAKLYRNGLKDIEGVMPPPPDTESIQQAYYMFVIRAQERDKLKEHLASKGIYCGLHFPVPIHLQPIYKEMYGINDGTYPNAEQHGKECISLPFFINLKDDAIKRVCDEVKDFYKA